MKNKPPTSLLIVWGLCVLWAIALALILDTGEIYTNHIVINTVNCEYREFKHRSYLDINKKEISAVVPRTSCDELLPLLRKGKIIIEKGPQAILGNSVVSWGLTVDGVTIKDFETSKGSNQSLFYFMGLAVSIMVFLSSLYGWRSGKWGSKVENT